MNKIAKFLAENVGLFTTLGLVFGFALGIEWVNLEKFLSFGLMLLLFFGAVNIPLNSLSLKDLSLEAVFLTFIKLIGLPIIVFLLLLFLPVPEKFHTGLLILSMTPAAVAAPGLTAVLNGNIRLAIIVSIATNLLVPFTMPFLVYFMIGSKIEFDVLDMFTQLITLIFVPFIFSELSRKYTPDLHSHLSKYSKSYIALVLFSFGVAVMAPFRDVILDNLSDALVYLLVALGFSGFLIIFGYLFTQKKSSKSTGLVIFALFNIGLSIVVGTKYFDHETVMLAVFYEVPWALLMIPLQKIFAK